MVGQVFEWAQTHQAELLDDKASAQKYQPSVYVRDGGNRETFRGSGAQPSRREQDH